MRLFFTATPLVNDSDKPKPSNQLASTNIHYDGGTRDFNIDMGAVSLMLFEIQFTDGLCSTRHVS